jgi:hypothetical protein
MHFTSSPDSKSVCPNTAGRNRRVSVPITDTRHTRRQRRSYAASPCEGGKAVRKTKAACFERKQAAATQTNKRRGGVFSVPFSKREGRFVSDSDPGKKADAFFRPDNRSQGIPADVLPLDQTARQLFDF